MKKETCLYKWSSLYLLNLYWTFNAQKAQHCPIILHPFYPKVVDIQIEVLWP